jgi:hypothetical protein
LSQHVLLAFNLDIPVVENLYTNVLELIKRDMSGMPDQKEFGESNRSKNICSTPMCVAGSIVWLAGSQGYRLTDEFGFETAAGLIHKKSRPDAPMPRFDAYPNEWALAFIEARAAEEQK